MSERVNYKSRDLDDYVVQYRSLPFEQTAIACRRRRILKHVAEVAPRRLLEVGCGDAPLFTSLGGIDVTVIEPAQSFADGARSLAVDREDVHIIHDYAEVAPASLPGAPFDMVIVSGLLHEVPDPIKLLESVRRWCVPSTVLHVNVPNADSLHRRLGRAMDGRASVEVVTPTQLRMQQRKSYTFDSLQEDLRAAGFYVERQGGILFKPFSHSQMQAIVDGAIITPETVSGLEALGEELPELSSEIWVEARPQPR